jgi:hypothetical protein
LAQSLERHIATIAGSEHNVVHYDELEKVAGYLEATLASMGYAVGRQEFLTNGKPVRNIEVVIEPAEAKRRSRRHRGRRAHYDSVSGSPGANDNASGAAAVIELARLLRDLERVGAKRIRLAFFVNEEPPHFRTEAMGSLNYARALGRSGERVVAMYSLETIGFYSNEPGSQLYPWPFGLMFPDRADFVAFVGLTGSRALVRQTMRSFRSHTSFPTIGGVAPGFIPGIAWSDHWAFARARLSSGNGHGYGAIPLPALSPPKRHAGYSSMTARNSSGPVARWPLAARAQLSGKALRHTGGAPAT